MQCFFSFEVVPNYWTENVLFSPFLVPKEIAGWKTCHYPHRSELSAGFLQKIREEISEKPATSVNKSRSTPRAHSPQKVPTSGNEKIEKPSKTPSWTGQKLPSAPICKAGEFNSPPFLSVGKLKF